MPRHDDAGPLMSPLIRSPSGRLPPAYYPWNRRAEPNNGNDVQTDPTLDNASHETVVSYNAEQSQHDQQGLAIRSMQESLPGEETEKGQ